MKKVLVKRIIKQKVRIPEMKYEVHWYDEVYTVKTTNIRGDSSNNPFIHCVVAVFKNGRNVLKTDFYINAADIMLKELSGIDKLCEIMRERLIREQSIVLDKEDLVEFLTPLYNKYIEIVKEVHEDPTKTF